MPLSLFYDEHLSYLLMLTEVIILLATFWLRFSIISKVHAGNSKRNIVLL